MWARNGERGRSRKKIARHENGEVEELRTSYGKTIRVFSRTLGPKAQNGRLVGWRFGRGSYVLSIQSIQSIQRRRADTTPRGVPFWPSTICGSLCRRLGWYECVAESWGKGEWGPVRCQDTKSQYDAIHRCDPLPARESDWSRKTTLLCCLFSVLRLCLVLCMSCASYSCTVVFAGLVLPTAGGLAYVS